MHDPMNLAYLDPVSGSTVFQLVIASALTVLTSVRSIRSTIGDFFRRMRGSRGSVKERRPPFT